MSDVATVVSAPIIAETRARRLDPLVLISGLDVSLADMEDPRGRIPWQVFVEFAEIAAKMLGSDTLEELAAAATVEYAPMPLRRVLPRLRDSRTLFTLAPRWWGPWVFRGTRGRCERLPDGRLREIVQILPGYSACPEFFEGLRGTLRGMPRLLDQPDALVTLEHDGREGEFIITPPPRRERRWLFGGGIRLGGGHGMRQQLAHAERDLEEFGIAREQFLESQLRVQSLTTRVDEQSRSLDALDQLGLTLVGEHVVGEHVLGKNDVDQHNVGRTGPRSEISGFLRRQLGVAGVRLSQPERGGEATRVDVSGCVAGAPDRTLTLSLGGRRVGLLELWGVASMKSPDLLDSLCPWLAVATGFRSSQSQVAHLTRLLSEDLRDWEAMERSLERIVAGRGESPDDDEYRPGTHEGEHRGFDLAGFLRGLEPRLRTRFSDEVGLDLQCAEGLWTTHAEGLQVDSFVWDVLVILGVIGSEQIRIQSRAVSGRGRSGLDCMLAEIVIIGRGGQLDAFSRRRLHSALERSDTGALVPDLDVRTDAGGDVWVRVRLPLITFEPTARIH